MVDFAKEHADREGRAAAIDVLLRQAGVKAGQPEDRMALSRRVAVGEASVEQIRSLMDYAVHNGTQGKPDGLLFHLLTGTNWQATADDWAASEAYRKQKPRGKRVSMAAPKQRSDHRTSDIEWVGEENPYGWRPDIAELMAADADPSAPSMPGTEGGVWNPYRGTWNLTIEQAREAGRVGADYRVRGCTRWSVLGNETKPTPEWDPACKRVADEQRGPRVVTDYPSAGAEPVYGERT